MQTSFRSSSLIIEKATVADAQAMFALIDENRGRLERVFPWVASIRSASDQSDFYLAANKQWQENKAFHFVLSIENKRIGACSVHTINKSEHSFEFGFWMDSHHEGKGYISVAVLALELEMKKSGFETAYIKFHLFNSKSENLARRLRYTRLTNFKSNTHAKYFKKL